MTTTDTQGPADGSGPGVDGLVGAVGPGTAGGDAQGPTAPLPRPQTQPEQPPIKEGSQSPPVQGTEAKGGDGLGLGKLQQAQAGTAVVIGEQRQHADHLHTGPDQEPEDMGLDALDPEESAQEEGEEEEEEAPFFPEGMEEHLGVLAIEHLSFPRSVAQAYLAQQFQTDSRDTWLVGDPFDLTTIPPLAEWSWLGSLLRKTEDEAHANVDEDAGPEGEGESPETKPEAESTDDMAVDGEDVDGNGDKPMDASAAPRQSSSVTEQGASTLQAHPMPLDALSSLPQDATRSLLPPPPPSYAEADLATLSALYDAAIIRQTPITGPVADMPPGMELQASSVLEAMARDQLAYEMTMPEYAAASNSERQRFFRCPNPYCSKVYRNSGGLRYHLERGTCRVRPPISDLPAPSSSTPRHPPPPTDSRVLIFLPERRPRIKVGAGPFLCRACPPERAKYYKSKAGIVGHYERQHQGRNVYESLKPDSVPPAAASTSAASATPVASLAPMSLGPPAPLAAPALGDAAAR